MDFISSPVLPPLRVLVTNPLNSASQLTINKIMSGLVFGTNQLIDLTLLVYSNERPAAEDLKMELFTCGFSCMNSITVSSDLPRFSDADIFCFITNFQNPNLINFDEMDDNQFDVLYLIIKIANNLTFKPVLEGLVEKLKGITTIEKKTPYKPIIMADGIVTMNILKYMSKDIPDDVFFCSTSLPAIAKNLLAEQIKVATSDINNIHVWAANDKVFHIEVEKPIVTNDKVIVETKSDWDMMGKDRMNSAGLDHTQFNESWLKKDFIEKVEMIASKNPYGSIYRASEFAKTLSVVWKTRVGGAISDGMKTYASVGLISDGSLDTIKGSGYVLPLVLSGDTWSVNTRYKESCHVTQELTRINKTVKNHKDKCISYCKKFLEEQVKDLAFKESDANESAYSFGDHSSPINAPSLGPGSSN